jgi:4-amino-4-deoxy-L-arabinose transferase-like glycosyltransferase
VTGEGRTASRPGEFFAAIGRRIQSIPAPSTDVIIVFLIVDLALILRIAWAIYSKADPLDGRFDDSLFYHLYALDMRDHFSYRNPFTGVPTAQWPPGYSAFLATTYTFFGESVLSAKVGNAFAGTVTVVVTYLLARRLFDRRAGTAGALLFAVAPGSIIFVGMLWSETFFTMLYTLALLCIATLPGRPANERIAWAIASGVATAAAAYTREAGTSLIVVALLYWFVRLGDWRHVARSTGVALAVAAVLLLPWAIRNAVQMDTGPVLTTSTGGNFWIGHNDEAYGGLMKVDSLIASFDHRPSETEVSERGLSEGLDYLFSHPGDELELSREKVRILYQDDSLGLLLAEAIGTREFVSDAARERLNFTANAVYYATLSLAGVGLLLSIALRRYLASFALPVVAVLVWTAGHIVFFADARFHMPMIPLFCIMAGAAVSMLIDLAMGRLRAGDAQPSKAGAA